MALGGTWTGAVDGVHQRGQVVGELLRFEAHLAERDVDDSAFVHLELHAAALDLAHRTVEVEGDGAGFGVRHEAAPAQDPTQLADHAHHVRRGQGYIEVEPAGLDTLDQVVPADLVGTGLQGFLRLVRLGEDDHAHRLADTMRQDHGAPHHLIGVPRIDPQPDVCFDGRVELDLAGVLQQPDGLHRLIGPAALDQLDDFLVALAAIGHGLDSYMAARVGLPL